MMRAAVHSQVAAMPQAAAPARPHLASLVDEYLRHKNDVAVVTHNGLRRLSVTYGELATMTGRFASAIESQRSGKGERDIECGENCAEWLAAFMGGVLRGVVVVPLDAGSTPAFANRITADVLPRLIVGSRASLGLFASASPLPVIAFEEFDQRLPPHPLLAPEPALNENDPLQIVYTSGTTAEPKGVVHTHRNVLASVRPIETEIRKYLRYERLFHPLRFLHTLPLSHVFGQFMGLWLPPLLGAALHFDAQLEPARLLHRIRRERITVLISVPRAIELLRSY